MSRIGRLPVEIPAGVEVTVAENNVVTVKGPLGTLSESLPVEMDIKVENNQVVVTRPNDLKKMKSYHGLTRTLIHNMVEGVVNGYSKTLEVDGVGYRVSKEGKNLVMNLGFSHKVIVPETEDIQIEVPQPNQIVIKGIDKQKVGQFAAEVREKRPPEPYKGKGIHYQGERIIRKEGKAGKGKK